MVLNAPCLRLNMCVFEVYAAAGKPYKTFYKQ